MKYSKNLFLFLAMILVLSSCSKKLLYLNDIEKEKIENFQTHYIPHKLQPYDYLDISITTSDDEINKTFKAFSDNRVFAQRQENGSYYFFSGYKVNDTGYIFVPIIGAMKVSGKTVEQVQSMLEQKIDSILTEAYVKVKLISLQIFFIGEVNTSVTFYKDRVNILEAISQIGGIPYSVDKKHVFIIRRQDSSKLKIFNLDLTSKHLLENKNFYLEPYDIVYFRPREAKIFRLNTQDYYMVISLLTTTASIISLILSLKK